MVMKISFLFVSILLMVSVCLASGITGRWSGTIEGKYDVAVNIKEEGEGKVSGVISSPIGEMPLSGGKVNGDDIVRSME
jgi:hypothetical protein